MCLECKPGYMTSYDKSHCQPKFKNCVVDESQQPSGLIVENDIFKCMECEMGFFWDGMVCSPCTENCLICDETTCDECQDNKVPRGVFCDAPMIPHCKQEDSVQPDECLECQIGFGLTNDLSKCVPCSTITQGCTACSTTENEMGWHIGDTCTTCIDNMELVGNQCMWDECELDSVVVGLSQRLYEWARCVDCVDGYGVSEDICLPCEGSGFTRGCTDCVFMSGNLFSCIECDATYELTYIADANPEYQCLFPMPVNCDEVNQETGLCSLCTEGSFWDF